MKIQSNKEKLETVVSKSSMNSIDNVIVDFDNKKVYATNGVILMCKPCDWGELDNRLLIGRKLIDPEVAKLAKDEDVIMHADYFEVPSLKAECKYIEYFDDKGGLKPVIDPGSVVDGFENEKPELILNFSKDNLVKLLNALGHDKVRFHVFKNVPKSKEFDKLIVKNEVIITSELQTDEDATGLIMQFAATELEDKPKYFENRIKNNIQTRVDTEIEMAEHREQAEKALKKAKELEAKKAAKELKQLAIDSNMEIEISTPGGKVVKLNEKKTTEQDGVKYPHGEDPDAKEDPWS